MVRVLVVDVGGSHVKLKHSEGDEVRRFPSGPELTPTRLVEGVRAHTGGWSYERMALGLPMPVSENAAAAEPRNIAPGWVGYDFAAAFGVPLRIVNDAVMQALGAYEGGRMLFVGLGTGVGSAIVTEHVLVPLEIGALPHKSGGTLFERLGREGLERDGKAAGRQAVADMVPVLREAFAADYVVLGGGNAKKVEPLPPGARRGGNEDAFTGGFRLWEEVVEPHDRQPPAVWRVLR